MAPDPIRAGARTEGTPAPLVPSDRPPSPMSAVEVAMNLQPIEELLAERDHLVEQVADLRAKYGSFGTFDHIRKIELSQIKQMLRLQAMQDRVKMSNDALDDAAHAHPRYFDLVMLANSERARWVKIEERIAGIDYTINRGQAVARYLSAGGQG